MRGICPDGLLQGLVADIPHLNSTSSVREVQEMVHCISALKDQHFSPFSVQVQGIEVTDLLLDRQESVHINVP